MPDRTGLVGLTHGGLVADRRTRLLAERLAPSLPGPASVLDVGCGDGGIAKALRALQPGLDIVGIDVLVRAQTQIAVTRFDGATIPYPDESFDDVLFVDVLHHTDDPAVLLAEAARVARRAVVVKDHVVAGVAAVPTLRFMDWVGNAHHGVALPYNYWREDQWRDAFREIGLTVESWESSLALYPVPARWLFDRQLHMLCRLTPG